MCRCWSGSVLYCGKANCEAACEADEGKVDVKCFFNNETIKDNWL